MSTITVTRPESAAEERYYLATQWQLIRRRFAAHRLALLGTVLLIVLYAGALFAEFLAPYDAFRRFPDYQLTAPQRVRLFHDGTPRLPFIYGLHRERHPETLRWQFAIDRATPATRSRCSYAATRTGWSASSPRTFTCSVSATRRASCSCSGPTTWAATCSRATCTRRASR